MRIRPTSILLALLLPFALTPLLVGPAQAAVPTSITATASNATNPWQPIVAGRDKIAINVRVTFSDGSTPQSGESLLAELGSDIKYYGHEDGGYGQIVLPHVLATGPQTITVTYLGRGYPYAPSSTTVTVDVVAPNAPNATTMGFRFGGGSSLSQPDALVVNVDRPNLTATMKVGDQAVRSGRVNFYLGSTLVATDDEPDSYGNFVAADFPVASQLGTYTVRAEYVGNEFYAGASATKDVQVVNANPLGDSLAQGIQCFFMRILYTILGFFFPGVASQIPMILSMAGCPA